MSLLGNISDWDRLVKDFNYDIFKIKKKDPERKGYEEYNKHFELLEQIGEQFNNKIPALKSFNYSLNSKPQMQLWDETLRLSFYDKDKKLDSIQINIQFQLEDGKKIMYLFLKDEPGDTIDKDSIKLKKDYIIARDDLQKDGFEDNLDNPGSRTIEKVYTADNLPNEKECIKVLGKLIRFYDILKGKNERSEIMNKGAEDLLTSKNIILYGPPGTGKSYSLINDYIPLFSDENIAVGEEEHNRLIADKYSWWQIIAAALVELGKGKVTDILNHRLVQAKDSISNQQNTRAMIWSMLQQHTKLDCENVKYTKRISPYLFSKDNDGIWYVDKAVVDNEAPEIKDILVESNKAKDETITDKRYEFITFHQSFSYEDFVEGIKPNIDEDTGESIQYTIQDGVFKKIVQKAIANPAKNYAIFIDEINRGNVSKIFGELITLIEDDKRIGAENEVIVSLPYSKEKFGVPANLYIVGSMNTADRSVEALDTALRRRFTFREFLPEAYLLEGINIDGVNLTVLLETINRRINILYDRDHMIGHSYFMPLIKDSSLSTLKNIFKNKIIPLLEEYFYSDWGKIRLILGDSFIKKDDSASVTFKNTDDYEYIDEIVEKKTYRLVSFKEFDLLKALDFKSIYE